MGAGFLSLFPIKSNYLDPVKYPNHFKTAFYIEVYTASYLGEKDNSLWYNFTLKADLISGSVERSRDSDYSGSCSLEIVISPESIFNPKYGRNVTSVVETNTTIDTSSVLLKGFRWEDRVIRIVKTYDFLNDRNKEYYVVDNPNSDKDWHFNDNDRLLSSLDMGWYMVDSTSVTYNESTRTLSISGTDLISILGSEHGSALMTYWSGTGGFAPDNFPNGLTIEAGEDASGVIDTLMGSVNGGLVDPDAKKANSFSPIDLTTFININSGNNGKVLTIPYDLEFDSGTTLFEVLKKIKELYGNVMMYIGNRKTFFMRSIPVTWFDEYYTPEYMCYIFARNLSELVIDEKRDVNLSGICNTYTICGRVNDETKKQAEATYSLGYTADFDEDGNMVKGSFQADPRLWGTHPFDAIRIGTRRTYEQDDNLLTDEECWNKGKWDCWDNVQFRETVSITLTDSCFPAFIELDGFENFGIGKKIEYTSIQNGETNTYLIDKVSHDFTNGTWTLELEPFYPLQEEEKENPNLRDWTDGDIKLPNGYYIDGKWTRKIKTPNIKYKIKDNGLVSFTLSNQDYTEFTLFKIYIDGKFAGETCTEDEDLNKVFEYQFERNGTYTIQVQGYSPQFPPSDYAEIKLTIDNITTAYLTNNDGKQLTNENYIPLIN